MVHIAKTSREVNCILVNIKVAIQNFYLVWWCRFILLYAIANMNTSNDDVT